MAAKVRGFTLVELVIGLVVFVIVIASMSGLLINQTAQSVDPVQQVRAAQLAQRLLGEILARSFDEQSDHNGSHWRCGEAVNGVTYPSCTSVAAYGPDAGETLPSLFNDVDDYQTAKICSLGLTGCQDAVWIAANFFTQNMSGVQDEYRNFLLRIQVTAADLLPACVISGCATGKRIEVTVRLPDGNQLPFAVYRGNY